MNHVARVALGHCRRPVSMLALALTLLVAPQEYVRPPAEAVRFAVERAEGFGGSGSLVICRKGELLAAGVASSGWTVDRRVACPEWSSALVGLTALELHDQELIDASEHAGATLPALDRVPGPLTVDDLILGTTWLRPVGPLLLFRGRGERGSVERSVAVEALAGQLVGGPSTAPLSNRLVLEEILETRLEEPVEDLVARVLFGWKRPSPGDVAPHYAAKGVPNEERATADQLGAYLSALDIARLIGQLDRNDGNRAMLVDPLLLRVRDARTRHVPEAARSRAAIEHVPSGTLVVFVGDGRASADDVCHDALQALLEAELPEMPHARANRRFGARMMGRRSSASRHRMKHVAQGTYRLPELDLDVTIKRMTDERLDVRIGESGWSRLKGGYTTSGPDIPRAGAQQWWVECSVAYTAPDVPMRDRVKGQLHILLELAEDGYWRPRSASLDSRTGDLLQGLVIR